MVRDIEAHVKFEEGLDYAEKGYVYYGSGVDAHGRSCVRCKVQDWISTDGQPVARD